MSDVLIVTAHLDDFEFGMGGTVARLRDEGLTVRLVVMCKGDRPGAEHVKDERLRACRSNCHDLGMFDVVFYKYPDTYLDDVSQTEICSLVNHHVNTWKPSVVYTHHGGDVHNDHQVVSAATRVACRPRVNCSVDTLYEFTIPGSTEWRHEPTQFNVYKDITSNANDKMEMVSRYTSELREAPDPLSLEMIETRDKYHGSLCGKARAEVFKLVFDRS